MKHWGSSTLQKILILLRYNRTARGHPPYRQVWGFDGRHTACHSKQLLLRSALFLNPNKTQSDFDAWKLRGCTCFWRMFLKTVLTYPTGKKWARHGTCFNLISLEGRNRQAELFQFETSLVLEGALVLRGQQHDALSKGGGMMNFISPSSYAFCCIWIKDTK